ncbi:transforming growth factor-beta receptor-associated protein 1 [Oncorhynchus keta]|uniref:transforming growth factor-beta receptor-associated protein 1 n=1 Tax=Oncorhynchus keta TaxID=8018 RepID=UPI0015FD46D5|nr:transforming growth factor-beta receptor-associated protein 1 [Oncorhynchus keta]XP_052353034.1 transforming growth factor-beta receptor-associated protein 1 [Oncorhynchus keta]
MSLKAFTQVQVYEKLPNPKEKDKFSIHSLECYDRNIYIGTKDSLVQHLILPSSSDTKDSSQSPREGRMKLLGSRSPVTQLRVIPVLNHLLVLWDRSVSALNMFSLEPLPFLKRIQHVSFFEMCESALSTSSQSVCVELVTASSRSRVVRIHVVGVERWDCVKEVSLPQDPVALAVDDNTLCVATSDRYFLHDHKSGSTVDLFPHNLSRQNIIVSTAGKGEFLLNGPGSLGMFVMKNGICQRPPVQWSEELLAAVVCYPYILALQPQALYVYSMVDQRLKQTVPLLRARGLLSTTEGVYIFMEREILGLSHVPFEEQIQTLVRYERVEEALGLLGGVQAHLPQVSYKELHKIITCMDGFIKFYQGSFSEAKELFIKGELDPREIISLYPEMEPLCETFHSQLVKVNNAKELLALRQEDRTTFQQYLDFLDDFLRVVRGTKQGVECSEDIDTAQLRMYTEQGDRVDLDALVSSPNSCSIDKCVPLLELHKRFFTLGLLYQSHGHHIKAIQTWVKMTDGQYEDSSCSNVYEHIVRTLSRLKQRDVVWTFADWALQRNQEVGIQIFTKRDPEDQDTFAQEDVLTFLKKYSLALMLFLEFLVHDLKSKEEKHHTLLATAYVTHILGALQNGKGTDSDGGMTRDKLQQLLWQSSLYDTMTVHEAIQPTVLHTEQAILLGRAGDHYQALQTLVHKERDLQVAGAYCRRAAGWQERELEHTLFLTLLQIYMGSNELASAAVDLLNANAAAFDLDTVLQVLPDSWSVQLVSQFLLGSLRGTFHQRRMAGVERGLAQVELLRHKYTWAQASKRMLKLDKGLVCNTCQKDLTEPEFVCSLRGELVHTNCGSYTE